MTRIATGIDLRAASVLSLQAFTTALTRLFEAMSPVTLLVIAITESQSCPIRLLVVIRKLLGAILRLEVTT